MAKMPKMGKMGKKGKKGKKDDTYLTGCASIRYNQATRFVFPAYQYILVHISMYYTYQYKLVHISTQQYILVHSSKQYIIVHISTYQYIVVHSSKYQYIVVHISKNRFELFFHKCNGGKKEKITCFIKIIILSNAFSQSIMVFIFQINLIQSFINSLIILSLNTFHKG